MSQPATLTLTVEEAAELVALDQRRSYPEMSVRQAVEHARNTIDVGLLYDLETSATAQAYKLIVELPRSEVPELPDHR